MRRERCGGKRRRGDGRSDGALADGSDGCGGGGERVGDDGERDLPCGCGTLDDGGGPRAAGGEELARQQLNRLQRGGSGGGELAWQQLHAELLRLRRRILGAETCLIDDLWTGGYGVVGRGHLWSRED